jgi:FkbM family methyltransferase
MSLLDRIFSHPALAESPPVLIDVGASGGIHPAWRTIAPHAIGLGFEPDARERAALAPAHRMFKRWILCDKIVVAEADRPVADLHLTDSPFCSSTLMPDQPALADWAFARLFAVQGTRQVKATTLAAVLEEHRLPGIDWLKCDTQGTDLRIWQSLPVGMRRRTLAVEFEPGLISAYAGEDKFHHVLTAMEAEPFWLGRLEVQGTPRGHMAMLQRRLGSRMAEYFRKYGPAAPGWVNALYLHRAAETDALDLRGHLLLWVFAKELNQHSFACEVAEAGARRYHDPLCEELAAWSARRMQRALWATWPRWPVLLWQKYFGA